MRNVQCVSNSVLDKDTVWIRVLRVVDPVRLKGAKTRSNTN